MRIRARRSRIKGRDLYDYVFYLPQGTAANIRHLDARLHRTGFLKENDALYINNLKEISRTRFSGIDYKSAKEDVLPFITKPEKLDLWSADFFQSITENLTEQ